MRHFSDADRRARLARRHGLAAEHRYGDPVSATVGMTVLHATEAASVHLALAARVAEVTVETVDAALYEQRTLVKQLAMRRTLFVFPRDLLGPALAGAAARTAEFERRKLVRDVEANGWTTDGDAWLAQAREEVLAAVGTGTLTTREIRSIVPHVDRKVLMAPGTKWGGEVSIGPRVLTWLGARGDLVRAANDGRWTTNRPRWTAMSTWLGTPPAPSDEAAGYAALVRRWLWTFGPGTETDLVWWLGATKATVRRALAEVDAVAVTLDGGATGWVLPGDDAADPPSQPWAALVPTLDPTTMGWRERGFYLDQAHVPALFDSAGNAGPTAWLDGRIVGSWAQDESGQVQVLVRADVGRRGRTLLRAEAKRLSTWLGGQQIRSGFAPRPAPGQRAL